MEVCDELISVIIPVYNTEKYLRRCVESVLAQKEVCFEIILVDDGSTDASPAICDEYAKKANQIKVIHKNNQGLGYARNSGLDAAQGNYIFFLDSDDWIPPKALENIGRLFFLYNADIISFSYIQTQCMNYIQISNREESCIKLLHPNIMEAYLDRKIGTTACAKAYKRHIFSNVRFTNVSLHEDAWSMHLFLQAAESLLMTNQVYYVQYIRRKSLFQSTFREDNFLSIECGKRLLEFVDEEYAGYPDYHEKAAERLLERQVSVMSKIIGDGRYAKYRKQYASVLRDVKREMKDFVYEEIRNTYPYGQAWQSVYHPRLFFIEIKLKAIRDRTKQFLKSVLGSFI